MVEAVNCYCVNLNCKLTDVIVSYHLRSVMKNFFAPLSRISIIINNSNHTLSWDAAMMLLQDINLMKLMFDFKRQTLKDSTLRKIKR